MLMAKSGGSADKLYPEDVFSTYLYTGNGSTQTITNGIDLAGEGGMVWLKSRGALASFNDHTLFDTSRGIYYFLRTNTTDPNTQNSASLTAFNSNGFSLWVSSWANESAISKVAWTFRKAPKFFDVVTYTGNGVAGRQIAHNLGVAPGMIVVKRTSAISDWPVYHRGANSGNGYSFLNSTNSFTTDSGGIWGDGSTHIEPTATVFTINSNYNASGSTYVAYLFAHDTDPDGMIQCGSFTTDGSGNATVNLGWEPQYLLMKRSSGTDKWRVFDSMRGMPGIGTTSGIMELSPSDSNAENSQNLVNPTPIGFQNQNLFSSSTYIYLAIRRPNKPPTSGSEVYNAIARTGTGAAATVTGVGFAPDLACVLNRNKDVYTTSDVFDRLRGPRLELSATNTVAEQSFADSVLSYGMDGISLGADGHVNYNGKPYINWFFRRAPGFFDVVCYTGTGSAAPISHNLCVVPELIIQKTRSIDGPTWNTYHKDLGQNYTVWINSTSEKYGPDYGYWSTTAHTATAFSIGSYGGMSGNGETKVAYLFATLPGISKVGSYTGNGSSQTINCGFSAGARFVLIKRTDSTGDWYVWDSVRGIVAANDPHLSLNTTAAEVTTDDSVDPDNSGFIVNQVAATNINVTSATYIYLAIS